MRLPPKKSKQKKPIDFTTPQTAVATAPSLDYEGWMQEGIKQEEQGERYQSGAKAARHYSNAVVCFAVAASLSSTSFDPRYNAARVLYQLASEHLPPPEALTALGQAITGYGQALAVVQDGTEGSATARIDGMFNLAQADAALYEMLEEGAVISSDPGMSMEAAREAKRLFVEVERLQRIELDKVFGGEDLGMDESEAEEIDDSASSAAGSEQAVQALETTIVTPQLVLDTLLESISLDTSLQSSLSDDPAAQSELLQSAMATYERAATLRASIPGPSPDLDLELSLAHFSILAASPPTSGQATMLLQNLLSSTSKPSPSLLSTYADHLLDSLSLSEPLPALLQSLEHALNTYRAASSLLSSRLSPPKDVSASQIPSLLSANLISQAYVHLLTFHLLSSAAPSSSSTSAQLQTHLSTAQTLALDSISALKSGLSLSLSPSPSPAPSASSSSPPAGRLTLVRTPGASVEPRTDTRTLLALRTSFFTLVRIRLRLATGAREEEEEEERTRFWPVWSALTRGARDRDEVRRADVAWWVGESGEDKVAEAMGGQAAARERTWWCGLLQ
ncbi:hypothetical protein JCM1841_004415 [Sporobolomyces salmonicolor]